MKKSETRWVLLAIFVGVLFRWFRALEPAPFADSYHHWLVAARLVDVGGVSHLFTHPDGAWPPLYSLFAAAILYIFGTSSMTPLVWGSIACFALTTWMISKLAAPQDGDPEGSHRAPIVAAFLYALCPLDILTSSTPAMEPLAVLLVVAHWYVMRGTGAASSDPSDRSLLLSGLFLALACLTRYEAWGVLAFSIFQWKKLGLRRVALLFGPAMAVCAWWLIAASLGALQQKLSPEAARHIGAEYSIGALYGRFAVLLQTLFLATSSFLPMGLLGLRRASRLHASVRAFALFLVVALFLGVISGAIAGSHRYVSLALPVLVISAARAWCSPTRRGSLGAAALLLVSFWIALIGYYLTQHYQADLGTFWFYLQPMPLVCLFFSALAAALATKLHPHGGLAAIFLSLSLAIVYLPIFSSNELGRFIKPFQFAGELLHEEQEVGVVLIDNPVAGYFSQIPPKELWMANRRKELEDKFPAALLDQLEAQIANPTEVLAALRAAGVTHIVSEEVPYLFTRASLLQTLTSEEMTAIYWTRAFIFREVAVFRLSRPRD